MIFKSIRLQNFRQYKHDITFEFAVPNQNKNNITLFIAANGVGKTTLLQAFRYCFYGEGNNYLNLPGKNDLVNNTLVNDINEMDETTMFVEVHFEHEGTDYIARRESKFMKKRGVLVSSSNDSSFSLSFRDSSGYKPFRLSEANEKIQTILPAGLSYVFMFDGERMEKNISDREFSQELKESILGILDIKKYDKLIEVLGSTGKRRSVLGMLSNKKRTSTDEERKIQEKNRNLLNQKEELREELENIQNNIDKIEHKIHITKEQQTILFQKNEITLRRNKLEESIKTHEDTLEKLAREYIKESRQALLYKMLLLYKPKYDNFVNKGRNQKSFYSYLHISTINDIQEKGVCLCGNHVDKGSLEYQRLEELKKTSLPFESAQHLNMIDQRFKQTADFKDLMKKLEDIRSKMKSEKKEINDKNEEIAQINHEIKKLEKQLGVSNQDELERLNEQKISLISKKATLEEKIRIIEGLLKQLKRKIDRIDANNQYNKKINEVIDIIEKIKEKLIVIKNQKDNQARSILAEKFNESLSSVIHGNYRVNIDSKYQIKIIDLGTNNDVTTLLSTGQNVVISLTFINALIETAKQLSKQINKQEKYGVIMDAALSNLDEIHIDRLCKNTINNMDQLIFLSFKRQLRDEMYQGIKGNIGKAYVLNKHEKGYVYSNQVDLNTLETYIHTKEE